MRPASVSVTRLYKLCARGTLHTELSARPGWYLQGLSKPTLFIMGFKTAFICWESCSYGDAAAAVLKSCFKFMNAGVVSSPVRVQFRDESS